MLKSWMSSETLRKWEGRGPGKLLFNGDTLRSGACSLLSSGPLVRADSGAMPKRSRGVQRRSFLHLCSRVSPHVPRLALQQRVDRIVEQPTQVLDIKGVKPLKAVEMLRETLQGDPQKQEVWRAKARVASILGSCPRSKASFRSGIKHWIQFIEATRGAENMNRHAFPPLLDDVLAWANTFACLGA